MCERVIAFLLGGGASFLAHGGKARARAVVNTSPEPVSNALVSSSEDVATVGVLWGVYAFPEAAAFIACALAVLVGGGLWLASRVVKRVFFGSRKPE